MRANGKGWTALCPAHEDHQNSLSVNEGEGGRALLMCFAGCETVEIVRVLSLSMADLFPPDRSRRSRVQKIVASYDYLDAEGNLLFQVIRYKPKTFKQRRPAPGGKWIWDLKGVQRVLYRLPELLTVKPDDPLFIVEGEKDADRLRDLGFVATTNAGGAGKWREGYNAALKGRHVVIIADNDAAGQEHAQDIASHLHGVAATAKVLDLPGLPPKGDVSDWIDGGHSADDLRALAEAAPSWEPGVEAPKAVAMSPPDECRFPRTDAGNGELFAHLYSERVRYDHRRKRWLLWTRHRWSPDCEAAIRVMAKNAARDRYLRAADLTEEKDKKGEAAWAIGSESRHRVEAALYFAQAEKPIADSGDAWDAEPYLLGCASGVVDLRSGTLRPGRPEDRITMTTGITFDPKAEAPRWERFVREVFDGDEELIDWVHRALGYSATGDVREQIVCLLYGAGCNGKTVFCVALRSALGDYAYNAPFATVELEQRAQIPNDVAALVSRRFVTAAETNEGARLNEARVKALSGGDPITARFLNQEFFTYQPTLKLWLCVNHLPRVRDLSYGFWRRVRTIPFVCEFKGKAQDKTLTATLRSEAPGILAWLVRGGVEWQRRGLEPVPEVVQQATDQYREDSDPLSDFLSERCVLADDCSALGSDLYRAYDSWCHDRGLKERERLGSRTFGERMGARFRKRHGNQGTVYKGVAVAPVTGQGVTARSVLRGNLLREEGSETPVTTRHPSQRAGLSEGRDL